MPAILFGSISTVADTSELQRAAFNQAFEAHGLSWRWDQDDYREMLTGSGGQTRVAEYAASRDEHVDAKAVHETKSALFQENVASSEVTARPGVVDTIRAARSRGWKVALVTTTSPENVTALLTALSPELSKDDFDLVVDSSSVEQSKPDPASYAFALERLGESAGDCVAIEDNVGGAQAAAAAGVVCVAFPNVNTAGHDFEAAERTVDRVDIDELVQLTRSK